MKMRLLRGIILMLNTLVLKALIFCLVRYRDSAFSVAFELIRKDLLFCDVKTKKEKRQSSINKNELFRSMVEQSIKNEILFDYVLADNWFGSNENMRFIHYDMKKKFIMRIKSNRLMKFTLNL
jgi:hypothetical protein